MSFQQRTKSMNLKEFLLKVMIGSEAMFFIFLFAYVRSTRYTLNSLS